GRGAYVCGRVRIRRRHLHHFHGGLHLAAHASCANRRARGTWRRCKRVWRTGGSTGPPDNVWSSRRSTRGQPRVGCPLVERRHMRLLKTPKRCLRRYGHHGSLLPAPPGGPPARRLFHGHWSVVGRIVNNPRDNHGYSIVYRPSSTVVTSGRWAS